MAGAAESVSDNKSVWRSRYLTALEEIEQLQERLQILTRALVRVSLVADGQDSKLDTQLAQLRRLVRDNGTSTSQLDVTISTLEGGLRALDQRREQQVSSLQNHFEVLHQQLSGLKPGIRQRINLQRLRRQLERSAERYQDLVDAIGEWVRFQGRLLSNIDGFDAAEVVEDFAGDVPLFSDVAVDLTEGLSRLLNQIPVPAAQEFLAEQVRQQLDVELQPEQLSPVLYNLSCLLAAALDGQESEFQEFLLALNQRLQQAVELLQSSALRGRNRLAAGDALQESVRGEVSALHHQVQAATDMNQLQEIVQARLDAIVSAVDQYQQQEHTREQEEDERVTSLLQRMRTMEEEVQLTQQALAEQRRQARLDALTQLPNRQALDERATQEYLRWQRYQRPLTLAIADLDRFKQINDTYGHLAGDKVLKVVARLLRERLRATDFLARYGGEEFVLLLPETGVNDARVILEDLRTAIAGCPFHFRDERVPVTLSIGYDQIHDGDTLENLFERADQALYSAKSNGRDSLMSGGVR